MIHGGLNINKFGLINLLAFVLLTVIAAIAARRSPKVRVRCSKRLISIKESITFTDAAAHCGLRNVDAQKQRRSIVPNRAISTTRSFENTMAIALLSEHITVD
jgi:hypothetical protein